MKKLLVLGVILTIAIASYFALHTSAKPIDLGAGEGSTPTKYEKVPPPTPQELLALTNKERINAGLPAIIDDQRLDTSAQQKADDEVANNYIAHVNPKTGMHGYEYLHAAYPECYQGAENLTENIYVNDSQHAVNNWMNSPAHKAQLLSPRDISVGFGVSNDQIVAHYCMTK